VINVELTAAVRELELGAAATGPLARRLRPQFLATHRLLLARIQPDRRDGAVALGGPGGIPVGTGGDGSLPPTPAWPGCCGGRCDPAGYRPTGPAAFARRYG
jgi:hypothetical protein